MSLRIYADFNSVSGDSWCWCLRYRDRLLDEVASELGLIDGQKVVLFYEDDSEEFEFDAVLALREGRWQARYDKSSYRLLRDDSDKFKVQLPLKPDAPQAARGLAAALGVMNLGEVIANLESCDDSLCIVAKRPWTSDSEAKLLSFTEEFRVPEEARASGYEYFLEVSVALEEVIGEAGTRLSGDQRIAAVIYYAENDAYPEWLNVLRNVQ